MPFGNSTLFSRVLLGMLALVLLSSCAKGPGPKNFVFFNLSRERIHEPSFLENPTIIGAQLKYT